MSAFNSTLSNQETTERREPYFVADDAGVSLDHFYIPQHYEETLKEVLVPHGMLVDRIEKLAADIAKDYHGLTIHFLVVLKGNNNSLLSLPVSIILSRTLGGSTFFMDLADAFRRFHDCKCTSGGSFESLY